MANLTLSEALPSDRLAEFISQAETESNRHYKRGA
jgi:hypothetical protein